ncbi:MAG: MotA/TolQ/ExbB proton channel family protein [Lachnospiraceae bacterium]|nr:MotA/TolQ/ExbB proton channel family protein [Lachnospiraceae bacterium]MDE7182962.1 MotA/TolQ/ExbB proton channel family protein [Lachnospiraceae bacterium]
MGTGMKRKQYYVLFMLYVIVVAFVLYLNGVFTGEWETSVNLIINIGFLMIIGILFGISSISFGRLGQVTRELEDVSLRLQEEYKEADENNLWADYKEDTAFFEQKDLQEAFNKYRLRVKGSRTRRRSGFSCDLEEYINEDFLDRVGMNFYNSGVPGTLTGMGILGTFLGLSMGLGAFSGDDIFTISDNVGSLLSGMKVAFHTSVYGIFFSLVFSIIYRSLMSDAYQTLDEFLNVFRQTTQPSVMNEDETAATMLVYQAGMANSLRQMLDVMKGNAMEQTAGVGRIVDQFTQQMHAALDTDFKKLGNVLKNAGESQAASAANVSEMVDAVTTLVEVNRSVQEALSSVMERQEVFARQLDDQKEMLADLCSDMSDEISSQLYTFEQMRNLYEK